MKDHFLSVKRMYWGSIRFIGLLSIFYDDLQKGAVKHPKQRHSSELLVSSSCIPLRTEKQVLAYPIKDIKTGEAFTANDIVINTQVYACTSDDKGWHNQVVFNIGNTNFSFIPPGKNQGLEDVMNSRIWVSSSLSERYQYIKKLQQDKGAQVQKSDSSICKENCIEGIVQAKASIDIRYLHANKSQEGQFESSGQWTFNPVVTVNRSECVDDRNQWQLSNTVPSRREDDLVLHSLKVVR
ncbi:hypothetical protein OAT84_00860 [Gammaproteobacteria bacterium]|nr:hypothetical protein [Gammaproteobacteria bacterium]